MRNILILILCFYSSLCFSNIHIEPGIQNKTDSLVFRSYKIVYSNPEYSLSLCRNSIKKANTANDIKTLAHSRYIMGLIYQVLGKNDSAYSYLEEALKYYYQFKHQKGIAACQTEYGIILYNQGKYDEALKLFLNAFSIAKETGYNKYQSMALNYIGKYYYTKGQFNISLEYYNNALTIAKRIKDSTQLVIVQASLAKHHETIGDYRKALAYLLDALLIAKKNNNYVTLGTACNHLGSLYQSMNNTEKSLYYHKLALAARKKIKYAEGIGKSYKNIAQIYEAREKYDSALLFYKRSLDLCKQVGYKKGITKCHNGIAGILSVKTKYAEALKHYRSSLVISEEMGYQKGIVRAKTGMGELYLQMNDHTTAIKYLKESLEVAEKDNIKEKIKQNNYLLYQAFFKDQNHARALQYHVAYHAVYEEFMDKEKSKVLAELKIKYETDKKENENTLLKKENEIKSLNISRKNQLILLTALLAGFLLMIVIIVYKRFQDKQKANTTLEKLNQKILFQNKELEKLNKKLNNANLEKDKFFSIIAHELRNPLWWFRNLAEMLSKDFNKMSMKKMQKAIQSLDESAKQAFHLIDNLLQWSRSQLQRIQVNQEPQNLQSLVKQNIALNESVAAYKQIELASDIDYDIVVDVDKDLINTVLRNLISNALKYTPNGGKILVSATPGPYFVEISVSDSGIGISPENQKKLFKEDTQFTTLGISQEKGSGIGLILCKEFVECNKGKIWVESSPGKGTAFKFLLILSENPDFMDIP